MATSILIIGDKGRLRDGLSTILLAFMGIDKVDAITCLESALERITDNYPSLVIVDGFGSVEDKCGILKRLLIHHGHKPCIVIANTLEQQLQAHNARADAVLMQGFSTTTLYETLIDLSIITDRKSDQKMRVAKPRSVTAVPPIQTTWS